MSANTNVSINVLPLDYITIRNNLVSFMSSQSIFKDYNFEGSNLSVLIDLLAFNGFNTAFYTNLISSEMWLDSAQLRDSVISHAKDLNYTPRSNKSSFANVSLTIATVDGTNSIVIPRYTSFTGRIGSNNYTFSTNSAVSAISTNNVIVANNISLYEGILTHDQWVYNSNSSQQFTLSNPSIDTTSLFVSVIENGGANLYTYSLTNSLFDLTANSTVYFLQAGRNGNYEILFGDGVSGRVPLNGAIITAEYRIASGHFADNISKFNSDGLISGQANVIISVNSNSSSGAFAESIASIKFNAPRHFETQESAIGTSDYESLLMQKFPEIFQISAVGGEDLNPPQFGKISITVALNGLTFLPASKITAYTSFIQPYMPLSTKPIWNNPDFLYIGVTSNVKYNTNINPASPETIETIVEQNIAGYNSNILKKFNSKLYYSQLGTIIDNVDSSIISNETNLTLIKKFPILPTTPFTMNSDFGNSLVTTGSFSSSLFYFNNRLVHLQDDEAGSIIMTTPAGVIVKKNMGNIIYSTGAFFINNLVISSSDSNFIKFYGIPLNKDLFSSKAVIMLIDPSDVSITPRPYNIAIN
jgi:hypothetical protein